MLALYIILGLIVLFLAVLIIRAAAFKPAKKAADKPCEVSFDKEAAINNLGELIKCKTVSYYDNSLEDDAEFKKLIDMLPSLYPEVHKQLEQTLLDDRGILYRWQGRQAGDPTVLMAHYDVVPVDEKSWAKPPFEAIIEDGVMWGRGTLDTKVTFNGILSAAENLLKQGFTPERDIYFAFSGGEEVSGNGAKNIVDYFEANGITPSIVIDEGGGVVEGVFPGVKQPCALIGIAEKGLMNLKYSVKTQGGHASSPPAHTAIGELSLACAAVEAHPFKMHLTKPVIELFDTLGRHSTFVYRIIFANLWCFKGVLNMICKKGGGEMNALVRTTVAFTQMQGSSAPNVLPPESYMVSNMRLNPADSVEGAVSYIRSTIKNHNIELTVMEGQEPSRISQTNCEAWSRIESAVADTWQGSIVSPYLMVQCSDSRHYGRISDKVYRFSAMALTTEERRTIHGHNERITLDAICKAVEFFIRVMKNS